MTPWQLSDDKPESVTSRRFRHVFVALLVAAGVVSLFISPLAWQLFVIYAGLGLVVGTLQTLGQLPGILGLVILVFGVQAAPTVQTRFAPESYAAWWQPGLVALAAVGLVHLTPLVARRFR